MATLRSHECGERPFDQKGSSSSSSSDALLLDPCLMNEGAEATTGISGKSLNRAELPIDGREIKGSSSAEADEDEDACWRA